MNSIREIIKTSHVQIFLFFGIMERITKESDLPKKKWGSPSIQQKYSHTKLTKRSSALYYLVHALENDVARACIMNSVRIRDAQ